MSFLRAKFRRSLPLALVLCLIVALTPFALADNPLSGGGLPVVTTPDAAEVAPAPPEVAPVPPETAPAPPETAPAPPEVAPVPPETAPAPPETAPVPPETVPTPPEVDPGAPIPNAAITTPAAARITTPDAVMTITNFNASQGPGSNIQSMKAAFGNALLSFKHDNPGLDWKDVQTLKIEGTATNLRRDDWEWLKSKCLLTANNYSYKDPLSHSSEPLQFAKPEDQLKTLDLSGLTSVTVLPWASFSSAGYNITPVEKKPKVQILLPDALAQIGDGAFYRCNNIEISGEFPVGLTHVGKYAFMGCGDAFPQLTDLSRVMGTPGSAIGNYAFEGCIFSSLTKLPPITGDYVSNYAFQECTFDVLTKLPPLNSNFKGIFAGASFPELISISNNPDGDTRFSEEMFQEATLSALASLPGDIGYFGKSSFQGAHLDNLTTFPTTGAPGYFPNTFSYSFGVSSFKEASLPLLTTIPDVVSQIGTSAFQDAKLPKLQTIQIQSYMDDASFSGADLPSLTTIHTGIIANGEIPNSFPGAALPKLQTIKSDLINGGAFKSATFGSPVTISGSRPSGSPVSIIDQAFQGATFKSTLTMPPKMESIEGTAFQNASVNGPLTLSGGSIGANAFASIAVSGALTLSGITSVGAQAFQSAQINGPLAVSDVASIGAQAFQNAQITGSASLSGGSIGANAFQSTQINGPLAVSDVASIGAQAFQLAQIAGDVTLSNVASIGEHAFDQAAVGGSLKLSDQALTRNSLTSIGAQAFYKTQITGSASLSGFSSIGANAFEQATVGGPLTLSGGSVGANAFDHAKITGDVTLAANTVEPSAFAAATITGPLAVSQGAIGPNAFDQAKITGDVTLADGVTAIGTAAFQGARIGGSVQLPAQLTAIESSTFQGAQITGSLQLPARLNSIGTSAFRQAAIGRFGGEITATAIGAHAFDGCNLPDTTQLSDTIETIGEYAFANTNNFAAPGVYVGKMEAPDSNPTKPHVTIYPHAFEGSKVTQWVLSPNDTVYPGAFAGATALEDVYFPWGSLPHFAPAGGGGPITDHNQLVAAISQAFPTMTADTGSAVLLFHYPTDDVSNPDPALQSTLQEALAASPNRENQVKSFTYAGAKTANGKVTGLKDSYQVWDTVSFEALRSFSGDAANPQPGDVRTSAPVGWKLLYPNSDTVYAEGLFQKDKPAAATIYPAQRPSGTYTLVILFDTPGIYYGEPEAEYGWRAFPTYMNMSGGDVKFPIEFLPPPTPAEASYLLTVQNGTGGGYFEAEHSAPIVAKLKAAPPTPGARFLHWELVSGTGAFSNPDSPETRFTMAVGNSTVKAVFDTGGAAKPGAKPPLTPTPTPSPPTGDSALPPLAAGLLLLAAGAAGMAGMAARKRRRSVRR